MFQVPVMFGPASFWCWAGGLDVEVEPPVTWWWCLLQTHELDVASNAKRGRMVPS
jgi:hypothetical protein